MYVELDRKNAGLALGIMRDALSKEMSFAILTSINKCTTGRIKQYDGETVYEFSNADFNAINTTEITSLQVPADAAKVLLGDSSLDLDE